MKNQFYDDEFLCVVLLEYFYLFKMGRQLENLFQRFYIIKTQTANWLVLKACNIT